MGSPTRSHAERLARLLHHVRRGWECVRAHPPERERARSWLEDHPSSWTEMDALWRDALKGTGALHLWLDEGADPATWQLELPLHSVLASHPFACLRSWSSPIRSSRS